VIDRDRTPHSLKLDGKTPSVKYDALNHRSQFRALVP
jgi:hypothetical protein